MTQTSSDSTVKSTSSEVKSTLKLWEPTHELKVLKRTPRVTKIKLVSVQLDDSETISVPGVSVKVFFLKQQAQEIWFSHYPLHKILILDPNDFKQYTPKEIPLNGEMLTFRVVVVTEDLASFQVNDITPIEAPGSIKRYPRTFLDVKQNMCVYDSNFFFPDNLRQLKRIMASDSKNNLCCITYTIKREALKNNKTLTDANFGERYPQLTQFNIEEWHYHRSLLSFEFFYDIIYGGKYYKNTSERWPKDWGLWMNTDLQERVESAQNDVGIWMECFTLAHRYDKKVTLRTLDKDFNRFVVTDTSIRKVLEDFFPTKTLDLVQIEVADIDVDL